MLQRILTTHAGSLPRPEALASLHALRSRSEAVDERTLTQASEAATRDVIAKQLDVGLDIVNNGEVGRESFFTYVRHRMDGFGGQSQRVAMADLLRYTDYLARLRRLRGGRDRVELLAAPQAIGPVRYARPELIVEECAQLKRLLADHPGRYTDAFVSSPSPGIIAAAMQNAHYDDLDSYVAALGDALAIEYRAIADAGLILQIDAPDLALERHTLFQGKPLDEFLAFCRVVVTAINRALQGIDHARVRLHVCWGNYEGPHDQDVPLRDIWPELKRAHVGAYLLSMANPRHAHEVRLLDELAFDDAVCVVPGVIDTTTNYIEHPETVADRIERAVEQFGDPTRIIAGTDCGFESSAGTVAVVPDIAWEKLRSLSEGARIASKRLFA